MSLYCVAQVVLLKWVNYLCLQPLKPLHFNRRSPMIFYYMFDTWIYSGMKLKSYHEKQGAISPVRMPFQTQTQSPQMWLDCGINKCNMAPEILLWHQLHQNIYSWKILPALISATEEFVVVRELHFSCYTMIIYHNDLQQCQQTYYNLIII